MPGRDDYRFVPDGRPTLTDILAKQRRELEQFEPLLREQLAAATAEIERLRSASATDTAMIQKMADWRDEAGPDSCAAIVQDRDRLAAECERLKAMLEASRKGQPLGPIIGANTIVDQELELKTLRESNRLLRAAVERWEKATTPSADTKAAYMGEFQFEQRYAKDGGGPALIVVPWTTIKEILAAIRDGAGVDKEQGIAT